MYNHLRPSIVIYDHFEMLKQEKRGKNLAISRPKNGQNCNFELLNAAFMYSAVFHKQAYSQKHFAHFQACLLTRAPTMFSVRMVPPGFKFYYGSNFSSRRKVAPCEAALSVGLVSLRQYGHTFETLSRKSPSG